MIIVKTSNGTYFINEKLMKQVWHDKENFRVWGTNLDGTVGSIDHVDAVTFVSDTQAMEFHDDGNIIEEMKAKMEQMETEKLAEILKNESYWNAKFAKAENELARLRRKLRDFGCEL